MGQPIDQELDFTVHFLPDLHQTLPFRSPTFRAEYFSFVFIKQGAGFYTIDEHRFPYASQTVYFTNPGHIKSFEIETSEDAFIITLTETFLRENVHPDIFEEFPFLLAEIVPPRQLSESAYEAFEVIYKQLWTEFRGDSPYKGRILGNLFVVLLLKIKESFWEAYDPLAEGSRDSQIVKSFKKHLERIFTQKSDGMSMTGRPQVRDFAEALHLHPNYLNAVIKSKTGKTVNDWITNRTLSAARSMLLNTGDSIKEISHTLGFSEPTHFNRFFRNQQQETPSAYRKRGQSSQ